MTDVLSVGNMGMVPEDDPTDPKKNIHLRHNLVQRRKLIRYLLNHEQVEEMLAML